MDYCGKDIVLPREGSEQNQRFMQALDPSSVDLNEFNLKQWMQFAYEFASHVNYFREDNENEPNGNWQSFFKSDDELDEFLSRLGIDNNIPPHLALYVCFLWLIEFPKKRFNQLTQRHLDFYYHQVLHLEKQPATPDKVHLIFELAKKATEEKIEKGTLVDGGKDTQGNKRLYEITDEIIVNHGNVSQLKNVYHHSSSNKIKAAIVANSYDGKGKELPENTVGWWPFGSLDLENAKLGFALASSVLEMREGERTVQFEVQFANSLPNITKQSLIDNLEVWCSGQKGWLGPFSLEPSLTDTFDSSAKIKCGFTIPREEGAVISYNSSIHKENFRTHHPVCRLLFRTSNEAAYLLYKQLVSKEIEGLSVHVNVKGVKSLELESDTGPLNASKPFYPFGSQPLKQSNFYINYPELFEKEWESVSVRIDWKNTPVKMGDRDAFKEHYYAYRADHLMQPSNYTYLLALYHTTALEGEIERPSSSWGLLISDPKNLIVKGDDHFKADIEIKHKEKWEVTADGKDHTLFVQEEDEGFATEFNVVNHQYERSKNGPLRISLNQTFYHELFPRIYALAFASDKKDTLIPKDPYTPMIELIRLDYSASESMRLNNNLSSYQENKVQLFHEHPFGQSEEHTYLKHQLDFLDDQVKVNLLVPEYSNGGELYIGLDGAEARGTISLLIQLLEGSENPEAESFINNHEIEWFVLCQNHWKPLDSNYMLVNQVNNFLKSGIVKFKLPKEADNNNSLLDPGLIWVKAKMNKSYNAVSKVMGIHAQASIARLLNKGEEWEHLQNGLEENSIKRLIDRRFSVKGIVQPYPSYGGKPKETDAEFYRRISERLKHKNRAITLWDYERLVLQEFPEIYKVKCLNHSQNTPVQFLAPGHVLLVVIPDMVNHYMYDIYQPRVSKSKLLEIQEFLTERSGMQVKIKVVNPTYEEVAVELQVRFHKEYDENYYLKKLNEDITRALSPHAFQETSSLEFRNTLHRSTIIHWVEKLYYVDWVKEVRIIKNETPFSSVSPTNPTAILVSAKQHRLTLIPKDSQKKNVNEEACQK